MIDFFVMERLLRIARRPLAVVSLLATALAAAAALAAGPAPANPPPPALDEGVFVISAGGQRLGTEDFALRVLRDSLCLASVSIMVQDDGSGRRDTVDKRVFMAVGKDDRLLHVYQSTLLYRGSTTVRGIVVIPGDTVFSLYREYEGRGSGDRLVMPPGRMFVMDSRLFSLIDYVTLTLAGQSFDRRPISVLALGERDTIVETIVARVGRDSVRSGSRVLAATHMRMIQGPITFDLWVDSKGRLLRLEHAPSGLLVERRPPAAVKPRAATPPAKKPGG